MILDIKNLSHKFSSQRHETFSNVSFHLEAGKMFGILGDSGCGKTTLLRCIAGLETPSQGSIYLRNKIVCSKDIFIAPHRRRVGFVFQDFALFPHLNVFKNIIFGVKNLDKEEIYSLADLFNIRGLLYKYPHEISGGQRQRVAFARAVAPRPDLLLLDEAFSSLDDNLRQDILDELKIVFKKIGTALVFVTHNEEEVFRWADKAGVMSAGLLQQVGSVSDLYHRPANKLVAKSFGRGSFISVIAPSAADGLMGSSEQATKKGAESFQTAFGQIFAEGEFLKDCQVFVRPEDVEVKLSEKDQAYRIIRNQDFGSHRLLSIQPQVCKNPKSKEILLAQVSHHENLGKGDFIFINIKSQALRLFKKP